jgi:hypothetical protein
MHVILLKNIFKKKHTINGGVKKTVSADRDALLKRLEGLLGRVGSPFRLQRDLRGRSLFARERG